MWASHRRRPCKEIILILVDDQEAVHRVEEDDHYILYSCVIILITRRPCMEGVKIEEREGGCSGRWWGWRGKTFKVRGRGEV